MAYLDDEDDDEAESGTESRGALASYSGPMSETGKEYLKNALTEAQDVTRRQQTAYDRLQEERQQQVQQQRQILDTTIERLMASRQTEGVTPLLAAASGFLAPTRTGGTGESFGNALNRITPALEHEERQRTGLAQQVGNLQFQGSALDANLLRERQHDLSRQILSGQKQTGLLARALAKAEQGPKEMPIMAATRLMNDPNTSPEQRAVLRSWIAKQTSRAAGRLYQIPDETSPTGYRYATAEEAAGKGAMGPSGMMLETDPATGKLTTVRMGTGLGKPGAAPGLTTTTTTAVEKDILKGGEQLMKLDIAEQKFKPEFHEYGEQIRNWGRGQAEKLGVKLTDQQKTALNDYSSYLRDVTSTMAEIRHELFGASLTKGEQESANKFIVTPDDSPTQAQAKLKGFKDLARKSVARLAYIKQHGLKMEDIPLDKMPVIIRARGNQLERDLIEQGLEGDQLKAAIKARLATEFGLGG